MPIKEKIENSIKEALVELGCGDNLNLINKTKDSSHGQYFWSSIIPALRVYQTQSIIENNERAELSDKEKIDIAINFANKVKKILDRKLPEIKKEISDHGFINFSLNENYFLEIIKEINSTKDEWGKSRIFSGKTILVEHSSPNLFKPFHIGHVMNNAVGESISRLAKFSNAHVFTISFPSDISLGVAKAIYIILEKHYVKGQIFKPESIVVLGNAYIEGTKRYEEDESIHNRVKEIANNIFANKNSDELDVYNTCKKFNMDYFEHITSKLNSHFDGFIYESESGIVGKKKVIDNTPGIFTESDGAIVYIPEESKKNINTAVFINSQGNPTYEAKDLGLLEMKFKKYNPDISIFITDNQQISHFNVVLDAAEKINKEWKEKSIHRTHGRMRFKGQKMSSRLGGVPLFTDILEVLLAEIYEITKDKVIANSKEDSEIIAIGALKFTILKSQAGKNIDFDPETSLSFEGNSGPYLQYSAVRANSILVKSGLNDSIKDITKDLTLPDKWQTTELERHLSFFPEIVERSINEWAPHHVVIYLIQLAQLFNSWYGNTKILERDDMTSLYYKLALTRAFYQTMKNGLWLLGIKLPEKM